MSDPEGEVPDKIQTEVLLQALAEELGFKETPDLTKYRQALKSADSFGDFVAGLREYQRSGEAVVDMLHNKNRPKGQIALILASAGIYYSRGMYEDFREALGDAMLYAINIGYIDLEDKIRDILSCNPKFTNPDL